MPPMSEPEIFEFPEGIGPQEVVAVEHEEVILMPRWIDTQRVTFKYGLGEEFIDVLKTLRKLDLHSTEAVEVCRQVTRATEEQRETGRYISTNIAAITEMIRGIQEKTASHQRASAGVASA